MEENMLDKDTSLDKDTTKPAVKTKDPEPSRAPKAVKLRVRCTEKCISSLYDQDRKQRISKDASTVVAGPVVEGSWLDCQMKAGLIEEVED